MNLNLQEYARQVVVTYYNQKVEKTDNAEIGLSQTYIVWFAYVLGNWKALVSTSVSDGMYYEVTYRESTKETYLDAYKKWENVLVEKG